MYPLVNHCRLTDHVGTKQDKKTIFHRMIKKGVDLHNHMYVCTDNLSSFIDIDAVSTYKLVHINYIFSYESFRPLKNYSGIRNKLNSLIFEC